MIVAPNGNAYKPPNFHAFKSMGGVIKPMRQSDWSSNILGSQEDWHDASQGGAKIYALAIPAETVTVDDIGIFTLRGVIQLRGYKE